MFDNKFNLDLDGDGIADIDVDGHDINEDGSVDLWMVDADNDDLTDFALLDTNDNGVADTVYFNGVDYSDDAYDENVGDYDGYADDDNYDQSDYDDYSDDDNFEETDYDITTEFSHVNFNFDIDGDGVDDIDVEGHDIDADGTVDLWMVDSDNDGLTDVALLDTNDNGIADTVYFNGADYGDDDSYDDTPYDTDDTDYDEYSDDSDEYIEPIEYEPPTPEIEPVEFDEIDFDDADSDSDEEIYDDTDDEDSYEDEDTDEDLYEDDEEDDFSEYDVNDDTDFDAYEDTESDDIDVDYDDDDGKLYGNPDASDDYWEFQGDTYRCAIYSQKFVIEELTGQDLDADEMAELAEGNGWFSEESGTPIIHMDKLLDHYGVENEVSYGNDMNDIEESLANGEKVIVSLDADEIWYGDDDGDLYTPGDGVNHAVEVIGVDHTDPDNPVVILNDSGTMDGQGSRIPLEVFEDAWDDGNNHMISCG